MIRFILHHAARIFVTNAPERDALAQNFEVPPQTIFDASAEAYSNAYRALAQNSAPDFLNDACAIQYAEDAAIELGWLTHFADAHYYQTFTPRLEQDAARARVLQAELLAQDRK